MIPSKSTPADSCPYCGAARRPDFSKCWLCDARLPPLNTGGAEVAAVDAPWKESCLAPPAKPFKQGLASSLLIFVLAVILLGIFAVAPGLAIVVAILVSPALRWTAAAASQQDYCGEPMSAGRKAGTFILEFFLLLGQVVLVIGTVLMALFATCIAATPTARNDSNVVILSLIGGGIVVLTISIVYIRKFRQYLHHKARR